MLLLPCSLRANAVTQVDQRVLFRSCFDHVDLIARNRGRCITPGISTFERVATFLYPRSTQEGGGARSSGSMHLPSDDHHCCVPGVERRRSGARSAEISFSYVAFAIFPPSQCGRPSRPAVLFRSALL